MWKNVCWKNYFNFTTICPVSQNNWDLLKKKHLLGVHNLWAYPLEDGENESANENPPSRNSKQIHHGVKVFLNSHFKFHPSFLYKFTISLKPLEVFRGILEAFVLKNYQNTNSEKLWLQCDIDEVSWMFIGVKMHFAEIAPNSVAYTFWEDIIQPNNEVIEITKVNSVFIGLRFNNDEVTSENKLGSTENYNFKKKKK